MRVDLGATDQVAGAQLPAFDKPAWNEAVATTSQGRMAMLLSSRLLDREASDLIPPHPQKAIRRRCGGTASRASTHIAQNVGFKGAGAQF
jgi:hypothetical protein